MPGAPTDTLVTMELTGSWRATAANDELRRTFHEPELDDRAWAPVEVPGHWSSVPALADARAVLHRVAFDYRPSDPDRRVWLWLDGIAQQGDVWLDGGYIGDTDGYFVPHGFEITDAIGARSDHVLAVDVSCSRFGDPDGRSSLTGALQDPELSGAAGENPGGIWRPVRVRETGANAMRFFRAVCLDANPTRARLSMRCVLDAPDGGTVVLRTRVADHQHELRHVAAGGENRIEWTFDVPTPDLWWPYTLGQQPLHDLRCEVLVEGEVQDHRECRIGFRSVRLRNWTFEVNGERLFTKGIGMLPTTPRPGDASPEQVAGDVRAAKDAGLDLIRLIAHIARPEVYETADQIGLLLWQDLPLRGQMNRGVRSQATRQAREAVDLLGHHPSLAVWCGHDEPFKRPIVPSVTPPVLGQQAPSWNRAVLDSSVRRVLDRTDGSRPIVAHTAVPPHFPQLDGTTSHLWFGWHGGRAADLAAAAARVPRMARFVTAFGAATIAADNPELRDGAWPAVDWEAIAGGVGAPVSALHHLVPPRAVTEAERWATLTEAAQADVIKTSIELLRRLKYRPTGGFSQFYLADPSPAGGFGVLRSDRRPKPSWQALVDACRQVVVVCDPLPAIVYAGERIALGVHVISDHREPIEAAIVRASIRADDTVVSEQYWEGTIPADEVVLIGTAEATVPDAAESITVDLELTAADLTVTNRYRAAVR